MLLQQIRLKNFRNYTDKIFHFNPFITIIFGKNAVGKTNLLEGIYFGYQGKGFREKREAQLIKFGEKEAMVELKMISEEEKSLYQIILKEENNKTKKMFFVSQLKKNSSFYQKEIGAVILFTPQQIEIISNSPEERRDYFDEVLSLFYPQYKTTLINYKNALRRRNKLLETSHNLQTLKSELKFWDSFLEKEAGVLTQIRENYINFLNTNNKIDHQYFSIEYKKNPFTKERIALFFDKEVKVKQTLIGPQKDDFRIYLKEKDVHFFGSRSEQRIALFWLKLNEIKFIEEKLGKKPLLLLDDVFSEFDLDNQKLIINLVKKYQAVLTTTNPLIVEFLDHPHSIIALS
jgi:DNA replication and repair protein RecF